MDKIGLGYCARFPIIMLNATLVTITISGISSPKNTLHHCAGTGIN